MGSPRTPLLLDAAAWMLGDAPDQWPRSRYSGAALRPGEMVLTIVVTWSQLFGHSYVVFEWFADELPGPQTSQRRHEVYHLLAEPTAEEQARGITDVGTKPLLSRRARQGCVAVEEDPTFFPRISSDGEVRPAYFRSWRVPFVEGWKAREAAAAAVADPPRYNYFELDGGKNCARWVVDIAANAGIDVRHTLSRLIAVPKRLIRPGERIEEEGRMWERRRQRT